jgi:hypothetical protein
LCNHLTTYAIILTQPLDAAPNLDVFTGLYAKRWGVGMALDYSGRSVECEGGQISPHTAKREREVPIAVPSERIQTREAIHENRHGDY